jgi:undecaprenyl-diphosphatase
VLKRKGIVNSFDLSILSFLNQFANRSNSFDQAVAFLSDANLLKGVLIVGMMWWVWFEREDTQRKREALLAALIASVPALLVAKILAHVIFRPRPLIDPRLQSLLHYSIDNTNWQQLSSFPSDHAVLFYAMATGIFLASRRAGWLAYFYVSVFICLPRAYLGERYPTDILAGAALGIFPVWLANRPGIRKPITGWALRLMEANPSLFYSLAFIVLYLVAELFDPLLNILSFIVHRRIN